MGKKKLTSSTGLKNQPRTKTVASKYKEATEAVLDACKVKGWSTTVSEADPRSQLATVHIHRYQDNQDVSAEINIVLNDGIEYSIQPTSFSAHAYGFKNLLTAISARMQELDWLEKKKPQGHVPKDPSVIISTILKNFDKTARQLRRRYDARSPYEINDEYDAQDLLHSILLSYFDDVRPEEYTPSHAGSSSKVDFLLKDEKSVIEVKYSTEKLKNKEIANQLIIDIKRYQTHPDCISLFCLVHDPFGNIRNPAGFEKDLSEKNEKILVKVIVSPH